MKYEELKKKFTRFSSYGLKSEDDEYNKLKKELKIEEHIDSHGFTFFTTGLFWNCECEDYNFVHSKKNKMCAYCGCDKEGQPDSQVLDVLRILHSLGI